MRKSIFILIFIYSGLFSQVVVHNKKEFDKAQSAYRDSMTMYLYGQFQIKVSHYVIKDNVNSGKLVMRMIFRYAELHKISDNHNGVCVLNGKEYEHYAHMDNLKFPVIASMDGDSIGEWIPDVYKYPSQVVIYKMTTEPKKEKMLLPKMESEKKPTPVVAHKVPDKKFNDTILMPSGERITRADFEKKYGTETYSFEQKQQR